MNALISDIIKVVAAHYGVSQMDILSDRRDAIIVHARMICYWLAKELTPHSYPVIGGRMNRDHTTIMHGVAIVDTNRKRDDVLQADLHELIGRLEHKVLTLPELVNTVRYMGLAELAQTLKQATVASGGFWAPPSKGLGDHLFVIDLLGVSASGFSEEEACTFWRTIAIKTIEAQAA